MAGRRRIRTFLVSGGVLVGALGVVGCGSAEVDGAPVEKKSFAFSGDSLTVDADDSELEIVPADIEDVRVSRQVDGWVFMGDGPSASWKLEDGRLVLRVECDGLASDCGGLHRIQVPRGVAVTVEDDNGKVTAEGFESDLRIRSDNGSVVVRDSSGALDLTSDNGEVVVEGRTTSERVAARSDNGSVRIALASVPARVDAVSDNGEIDIALPDATYDVDARSDNGSVRVDVPTREGSAHVVAARSDNGEVVVRSAN
ncbi:DUF4097 family beta strand repeat-containing protein [Streptomyces sp. P9(2023)]|uniref:DUF4097 family beta strand repeat-containing protein n=1 Tax=Streptomyces sp. P9(2023) TaxID=3064394 RepID=UPI0028F3E857|nr:DUF4097 family beta strand repeat-containing protein [Streptomyces sp. P9(2023)]MDT9692227.1 DUF4097 family beta strand repeat-containing protein [Streptomyces sp. P9(2023)]